LFSPDFYLLQVLYSKMEDLEAHDASCAEAETQMTATQVSIAPTTYSRKPSTNIPSMANFSIDDDLLFDEEELLNDVSLQDMDKSAYTERESPIAESPARDVTGVKDLEQVIRSLMTDDSVTWSMKTWYTELEKITHQDISSNAVVKDFIKSIVYSAGEYYISQTQTQPDDIFGNDDDEEEDPELMLSSTADIAARILRDDDSDYDEEQAKTSKKKSKSKLNTTIGDTSSSDDSDFSDDGVEAKKKSKKSKRKHGFNEEDQAMKAQEVVNQEVQVRSPFHLTLSCGV
jgi:hypothetical protein